MTFRRASHAAPIPEGDAAGWYQLLPAGTFTGRDGRGPYCLNRPDAVLAEFARLKVDLPVDYEHQMLDAQKKQGAVPAAGWIKELQSREDGMWARIEWTETAAACLQAKEYRYLSPVFLHNKAGEVMAITMAALTNTPNLFIQAASSREGGSMDELLERLRYMLNLPLASTAEDILAQLDKLKAMIAGSEEATAATAQMRQALALGADAPLSELATALQNRLGQVQTPDPAQYVPIDQYNQVAHSLSQLQAQQSQAAAEALVEQGALAGKVPPAQRTWALAYASRDPEGFKTYLENAPVLAPQSQTHIHQTPPPSAPTLNPDQVAMCRMFGNDPDTIAAGLKED